MSKVKQDIVVFSSSLCAVQTHKETSPFFKSQPAWLSECCHCKCTKVWIKSELWTWTVFAAHVQQGYILRKYFIIADKRVQIGAIDRTIKAFEPHTQLQKEQCQYYVHRGVWYLESQAPYTQTEWTEMSPLSLTNTHTHKFSPTSLLLTWETAPACGKCSCAAEIVH